MIAIPAVDLRAGKCVQLVGGAYDAERVRLFRLAWDLSVSSFAGRQNLYEYYFFGDPVRMAGALVNGYDRAPYRERVRAFLEQDQPAAV